MKKLAAVIIDDRPLPDLIQIINGHLKFLPKETELFIFHGEKNRYLRNFFNDASFVELTRPMTEREYNITLTSPWFWQKFLDYEHILIFQADSQILRKGIEDFYKYDYVGSPWKFQLNGGNGGISLRTPKIMHQICSNTVWDVTHGNEDVYYSNIMYLEKIGKLAPREVCMKWGAETVFELGTFCVHAIEKHLSPEECEQILNQYK